MTHRSKEALWLRVVLKFPVPLPVTIQYNFIREHTQYTSWFILDYMDTYWLVWTLFCFPFFLVIATFLVFPSHLRLHKCNIIFLFSSFPPSSSPPPFFFVLMELADTTQIFQNTFMSVATRFLIFLSIRERQLANMWRLESQATFFLVEGSRCTCVYYSHYYAVASSFPSVFHCIYCLIYWIPGKIEGKWEKKGLQELEQHLIDTIGTHIIIMNKIPLVQTPQNGWINAIFTRHLA